MVVLKPLISSLYEILPAQKEMYRHAGHGMSYRIAFRFILWPLSDWTHQIGRSEWTMGFWVDCAIRTIAMPSKEQWNQDKSTHSLKTNMTKHILKIWSKWLRPVFSLSFRKSTNDESACWVEQRSTALKMLVTFIWNPVPLRNEFNPFANTNYSKQLKKKICFLLRLLNKLTFFILELIKVLAHRSDDGNIKHFFQAICSFTTKHRFIMDWKIVTMINLIPLFILLIYSIL